MVKTKDQRCEERRKEKATMEKDAKFCNETEENVRAAGKDQGHKEGCFEI